MAELTWLAPRNETIVQPNQIPGLVLDFDPSYGIAKTGSNITSWTDRQMGFVTSQGTGALQPQFISSSINSLPAVQCTSQYLLGQAQITALEGRTGISIFMLTAGATPGAYGGVPAGAFGYQLHNDLASHAITYLPNNGSADQLYTFFNNGSNGPITVKSLGDQWSVKGLVYDGTQAAGSRQKLYNNFSLKITAAGPSSTFSAGSTPEVIIGGYSLSGGVTSFNGTMGRILAYNRTLNSTEIGYLKTYFGSVYGFQGKIQVIYDGNSLTFGLQSTGGNNYPTYAQGILGSSYLGYNTGVTSQTTAQMISDAAVQIDLERDAVLWSDQIVVCWEGTNDLYFGASAATAYSNIVTYCQARQAAGFKVVVGTILPRSNVGTPVTFETDRQTVNTNIRNNWATFADGLADIAADSRIGDAGDETNTTYYSADLVHLNNTGYQIVGEIVAPVIASV